MAGIIQQLTDITLTATPSVGSYLLSIDLDGVLKYKTDFGTISPVGFGLSNVDNERIAFGSISGLTSSNNFSVNSTDSNLIIGGSHIVVNSPNSSILGGECNTLSYYSCNSSIFGVVIIKFIIQNFQP